MRGGSTKSPRQDVLGYRKVLKSGDETVVGNGESPLGYREMGKRKRDRNWTRKPYLVL